MKKSKILAMLSVLALLLSACGRQPEAGAEETLPTQPEQTPVEQSVDVGELFSQRDLEGTYEEAGSAVITLEGTSARCSSNAVTVDGSTVTVTDEGTYILRGSLDDGMVIVNADKTDKVQLVLEDVSIHSQTCAPIYILQADKVFLTLAAGTQNSLTGGDCFEAIDENNIDAVIFSKEDLTLNGEGSLTVTSPAGHGIVSKDELTVTGGSYQIQAASHGLDGKDSVCIAKADMTITSGKDGIHAENDEDPSLGYVYIGEGSFTIIAEGDGISAGGWMQIPGGDYNITTGGGSANAQTQTSENWGKMQMPGMGGRPGDMGERPGGGMGGRMPDMGGFQSIEPESSTQTEDSTSIKAIKAGGALTVSGGNFTIDAADDAIHSNADLTVSGGSFSVATGDDGFHADGALVMCGGNVDITRSYEGLEGMSVKVQAGDISIVSTDDGINAAGGTDQSGFGGHRGGDMFMGDTSQYFIEISGGTVSMNASGDGIDSNGSLTISGGHTTVSGPTQGDTAVLDYETTGTITGGTFIGTGSQMMAQTFSSNVGQGVIALSVGNQSAGTKITVCGVEGNVLVETQPQLSYAILIVSTPQIQSGESYTVTVGQLSETFTAS